MKDKISERIQQRPRDLNAECRLRLPAVGRHRAKRIALSDDLDKQNQVTTFICVNRVIDRRSFLVFFLKAFTVLVLVALVSGVVGYKFYLLFRN